MSQKKASVSLAFCVSFKTALLSHQFVPSARKRSSFVALEFLGWQFKHVQGVAGVGNNKANGSARTLYSLRHTAITFRLLYGRKIDLLTLARNARTSVEMVEKFYSSNLSAEMNIDLLQGNRRLSAALN